MNRAGPADGLPTLLAAFVGLGSALFVSFLWYLLTWQLPRALGHGDVASRLNPFALPVAETAPPLADPLFWANLVASNVLIVALPLVFVRLLHRGSAAALALVYWALVAGLNLLFQARHLSPAYPPAHRIAYALDLAAGLGAAALGARGGTWLRSRLAATSA